MVGVSFDPPNLNARFAEVNAFPFLLLSDVDRTVGEAYETKRGPDEPSADMARRLTYLIDPEGRVARAYQVKDIPNHPGQVLEDFRRLTAPADR